MAEKQKGDPLNGKTPFERFEAVARGLVNVSKAELDKKVSHSRPGKRKRVKK